MRNSQVTSPAIFRATEHRCFVEESEKHGFSNENWTNEKRQVKKCELQTSKKIRLFKVRNYAFLLLLRFHMLRDLVRALDCHITTVASEKNNLEETREEYSSDIVKYTVKLNCTQ